MITGGARGQGRAHALALAAEGADIVVADAPNAMADLTYPLGNEDDRGRRPNWSTNWAGAACR